MNPASMPQRVRLVMQGAICAALLLLAASPSAAGSLQDAEQILRRGNYGRAAAAFAALVSRGKHRVLARLGQARALRRQGRVAAALRLVRVARRLARGRPDRRGATIRLEAELLGDVGRDREAIRVLKGWVKRHTGDVLARALLGQAYTRTGQTLKAGVVWRDLLRDWDNGTMDRHKALHSFVVGLAGLGLRQWQFASDAFEQAVKLEPRLYAANISWGWLFLHKYNVPDAEQCFRDVLKYDPHHPDALAGRAWVEWFAARPNRQRGRRFAEQALKINPHHVRALLYLAALSLYDGEYGKALLLAERALKTNPNDLEALAHLAAVHFLQDRQEAYRRLEARARSVNPRSARFYVVVGRFATRHHRYAEAVQLYKQAKALDPKDGDALSSLGIALLRTGERAEGRFWLREAWKVDKYNHQTLNLLNLQDELDRRYTIIRSPGLEFLVPKDESRVLARYVGPYLVKVLAGYRRKYHFGPKRRIQVELYDQEKLFTVRTFGEPAHSGILGVCFGPVITALSPSVGRASWAKVLHHELAHTIHMALSRSRVPRWFTEGLAEYETIQARKAWRRENRRDLYRAVTQGVMPGVERLDLQFTHSKNPGGVVRAYFQSSQMVRFLVTRWGYRAVNRALRLFGQNKSTAQIISAVTGRSAAAFDRAFAQWVRRRYAYYGRSFDPLAASVVDLAVLRARARKAPRNGAALANLAVGLFLRGKRAAAQQALEAATRISPRHPVVRFLHGELALRNRRHEVAARIYEALRTGGHDGYFVRMRLAGLARRRKAWKEALAHYAAAARFDPERAAPLEARLRIFARLKKPRKVLESLTRLAALREDSGSLFYSIVTRADRLRRWDLVRRFGRWALEVQPLNVAVHEKYAWGLKAGGRHREAIFEFQSALLAIPQAMPPRQRAAMQRKRAWIHLGMAESWAALRDPDRAQAELDKALTLAPNLPRALRLRRALSPDPDAAD